MTGSSVKKPGIIDQYRGWVEKYNQIYGEKCIVFVENGTFLELYDLRENFDTSPYLQVARNLLEIRITYGDKNDPTSHAMAGVTKCAKAKYYKILLKNYYTIVEALQITNPKDGPCQREVVNIISPGCNLDDMEEHAYIISILIEVDADNETYMHIACFNSSLGTSSIQLVPQDDTDYTATIDRLNEIICNIEYREILIHYHHHNFNEDIARKHKNILLTNTDFESKLFHWKIVDKDHLSHWKTSKYQEEYLENAFPQYNKTGLGMSIFDSLNLERMDNLSIINYIFLLEFIKYHNEILLRNIHRPQPLALHQSANLETYNSCYEKLNIFHGKDPRYTLFNLLDKTCTKAGSRLFRDILSRPLVDPAKIEERYDITDAFNQNNSLLCQIRNKLQIVDLERIHRRLSVNKMPPFEIPKLVHAQENIQQIFLEIKNSNNQVLLNLLPDEINIDRTTHFMKDIKSFFDIDLCSKYNIGNIAQNILQAGVSPELDNITTMIQTKKSYLDHIAKTLTALSQKIYINSNTSIIKGELVSIAGIKPSKEEVKTWILNNYLFEFNLSKNPRKPGGEPYNRYNSYKTSTCYQEFENKGGTSQDIANDVHKSVLKVYKPSGDNPANAPRLDLESEYTLTIAVKKAEKEGYCLDTTTKRMEVLKQEIKKYLEYFPDFKIQLGENEFMDLASLKYDTRTTRPKITSNQIKKISDDLLKLQDDLTETIEKEYIRIMGELYEKYAKDFEIIIDKTNYIDVFSNFSFLSKHYCLTRPKIVNTDDESSHVQFVDLRNIIMENILEKKGELYIPNSLDISKDDCYLLFGVNSAGKSCFLRSVGLALVSAQAGLFVPAKSMTYFPYRKIFTRTGNDDNIFKCQSSFIHEMLETKEPIIHGDKNSLVLSDELCGSTEVENAKRIVSATLATLGKKKASFIFVTHLLELVDMPLVQDMANLKYISLKVSSYDKEDTDINDPNNVGLNFERKISSGLGLIDNYGTIIANNLIHDATFRKYLEGYNRHTLPSTERRKSRYNKRFVLKICQRCGYSPKNPTDMPLQAHHILFQCNAIDEYIDGIHVHSSGNLIDLCLPCHQDVHQKKYKIKVLQTDSGKKYEFDPPYKNN